jgi:hypothetical protein
MKLSQVLWLSALLSSPLWGESGTVPSVTLFDGDSREAQKAWGAGSTEYTILDTDLKTEACTIGPDRYTKIYLQSPRHLLIQYKVIANFMGIKSIGSTKTLTLTPDMAGKTFAITHSTDWATLNRISVDERSADLGAFVLCPDLTVPPAVRMADMNPYDLTNSLLTQHPQPMDEIAEAARGLEPTQRDALYQRFRINPGIAFGNIFPGAGFASFREGDTGYGALFLLGDLGAGATTLAGLGLVLFTGGSALWTEKAKWDSNMIHASEYFLGGLAVWVIVKVAASSRATQYAIDYNKGLATTLGTNP